MSGITGILMSAAALPVCLTRPPKLVLHPPPASKSDIKPVPGFNHCCRKTTKKQTRKGEQRKSGANFPHRPPSVLIVILSSGKTPEEVVKKYLQKVKSPPEEVRPSSKHDAEMEAVFTPVLFASGLYNLHGAPRGSFRVQRSRRDSCFQGGVSWASGTVWTPVSLPVPGGDVQQRQQRRQVGVNNFWVPRRLNGFRWNNERDLLMPMTQSQSAVLQMKDMKVSSNHQFYFFVCVFKLTSDIA